MKHFGLSIIIFLLIGDAFAQNRQSVELSGDYGFLFLHSQDIRPIGQSYPWGIGAEYSYWLLKDKHWEDCHCYPRIGINLSYHNFDNTEVLGYGFPLYGFLEPWFRLMPNVFYTLRGGMGYSWASQPYDAETNPKNLSYSLHFNPFVMVGTGFGVKLNKHWRLSTQIRYNHISNGGQQEPNKGLNYPSGNFSLSYSLDELAFKQRPKVPMDELEKQRALVVNAFIAGKAIDASRVTYAVPGVAVRYSQQFGRTSAWVVGTEYINNLAYRKRIEKQGLDEHHHQLNLLLGHEFLLGNFTFSQLIGIYVVRDYDRWPDWYQRYGLQWFFWNNFSAGTAIKVHGHEAEFLDFRLGYRHIF